MEVREADDAAEFLREAGPVLARDEARHNLLLGIAGVLRDRPEQYEDARLWLVTDAGGVVGAALRTPPYNLVLGSADERAAAALAGAIEGELPGVVGAVPEVERFAAAWESRRGVRQEVTMAQGVYALERLVPPPAPARGRARLATEADVPLVTEWVRAFGREAMGRSEPDRERLARVVTQRVPGGEDAGFVLWEDGGPVSLAGYGSPTPTGIRIGPVYTPPEHRGRGYGSAVTAAATAACLAHGRRFCFLFTDLANPTSNRIYVALGYRRVCDSLELAFVPR